jgi:hypothetical protein
MTVFFKRLAIFFIAALLAIASAGCGKEKELSYEEPPAQVEENVEKAEEAAAEPENKDNLAVNPLSGLLIDKEAAKRRPVAVMINNVKPALPQSGIGQADIIYETLAEGNITRLLAVFQELDAEKIGPIRSARHYYLSFVFDHDAIYVHYGQSPQAEAAIKDLKPSNLNGISYLDKLLTWRDPERLKRKGMYEHSLYTNAERINKAWDTVKYPKELKASWKPMLAFAEVEWTPVGEPANSVYLPFSRNLINEFHFDSESRLYKRVQYNQPHIDELTNEQLAAKNIIVQYTKITHIPNDNEGRRDMELVGEGKGVYITNGQAIPISWSKKDVRTPTEYRTENGKLLKLNKGKTWIIVFPSSSSIELK